MALTVKFKTVKQPNSYRTEPNQTQGWEYKNRTRIEPKFSALVKNSNRTEHLLLLEAEQNQTLAVRVLSHLY